MPRLSCPLWSDNPKKWNSANSCNKDGFKSRVSSILVVCEQKCFKEAMFKHGDYFTISHWDQLKEFEGRCYWNHLWRSEIKGVCLRRQYQGICAAIAIWMSRRWTAKALRTLMMEAVSICEPAVTFSQTKWLYSPELEILPSNDWLTLSGRERTSHLLCLFVTNDVLLNVKL
jgi:hypothetical protein